MGKLYLLNAYGTNNYKIGVTSRDITNRINELQTGCPDEIILIKEYESINYKKIEKWLHRRYFIKRMEGEWFELTDDDVFNFKNTCKEIETIIESLKNNPFYNT